MWKWISRAVTMIVVSCYFFPLSFSFLPSMNTKMAMAAIGIVIYVFDRIRERAIVVDRDNLLAYIAAGLVSLAGIFSITYNHTSDYTYASYVVSMAVWMGGAYTAVWLIRRTEGLASCTHVCNYVIAVCVFQCISALVLDSVPALSSIICRLFPDLEHARSIGRLYGIGAALDVAGSRFAIALVMIVTVAKQRQSVLSKRDVIIYVLSYMLLLVVGNMIARTTTLGVLLSLIYAAVSSNTFRLRLRKSYIRIVWSFLIVMLMTTIGAVHLYNTNRDVREKLHFAFEGFFSLAETGEWHTTSNERLGTMYVWPDNTKTWLIGDGYFQGAANDTNFIGESKMTDFYMWTDVGYCRFLFYFGLIGLLTFSSYFVLCCRVCVSRFPKYKWLFIYILLINFIIWFKVSTDIFLVFALFLCVGIDEDEESEDVYEKINVDRIAE